MSRVRRGSSGVRAAGFAVSAPDCPPCFAASLFYGARGAAQGGRAWWAWAQFRRAGSPLLLCFLRGVFVAGGACGCEGWFLLSASSRAVVGARCVRAPGRWGAGAGAGPRVWGRVPVWGRGCGVGPWGRPRGAPTGRPWWCVSRWCPALPLPGGGSTIGAGGLSFRVRYGSGRFPAPLWPPGWGWGCGGPGWPAPRGGVGGLVLGCVVDAAGPPRPRFAVPPRLWGGAGGGVRGGGSCRPISTGRLSPLPGLHLRPIDPVVHWGPSTAPRGGPCGDLVLEVVSRLDAFSGYPSRTWPTSGAPGGTTGAPGVRPSRSSRTGDGSPRVSCVRRG